MSLNLSLANAISGLQAAQANLALISGNIANAQTPGYSRETLPATTQIIQGPGGGGVQTGVATRVTDQILNSSLRTQDSVTSSAGTLNTYYQRIQDLFGNVGDANGLPNTLANFSSALQTLATSPEDTVAQNNAVAAGQALTQQLNSMSSGIQSLRTDADTDIGNDVTTANSLLNNIANYNTEIAHARAFGESTAAIEDQRDTDVQKLAQLMDIQSFTRSDDTMVVLTAGGKTLVNGIAEQITFSPSGTASASAPLSKVTVNGIDITSEIKGGSIGALLQMRDTQLPALTAELNQFTQSLFNTVQTPPSSQIQTIAGSLAAGDTFQVTINGTPFNTAALPANPSTTDLVNAINAQLGATTFSAAVSNGDNIVITDSAGNPITTSVTQTAGAGVSFTPSTVLATANSGTSALGDANHFFAGVDTRPASPPPVPPLNIDNAATITINPGLLANPTLLNGSVAAPDPTIAQRLADALALTVQSFAPAGNFPAPLRTTLGGYAAQILGQNATAAANASDNATFQTGVQNEISTRATGVSGVNMDEELANLQVYQTAYSASARVIQAVQSMFDSLLAIQP